MENLDLANRLKTILKDQIHKYSELKKMQSSIMELLNSPLQFQDLMNLLKHKEAMVQNIAEVSNEARPFVSEWMQLGLNEKSAQDQNEVDGLLNQLTQLVEEIKVLDEKMIAILNPPRKEKEEDPQDLLNAYRALR